MHPPPTFNFKAKLKVGGVVLYVCNKNHLLLNIDSRLLASSADALLHRSTATRAVLRCTALISPVVDLGIGPRGLKLTIYCIIKVASSHFAKQVFIRKSSAKGVTLRSVL